MNYDPAREEDIAIVSRTTRARALKREADRLRQWAISTMYVRAWCDNFPEDPPEWREAFERTVPTLQALDAFASGDRSPSTMWWGYPLIEGYNRDKFNGERPGA